jgi:hypothetical protein
MLGTRDRAEWRKKSPDEEHFARGRIVALSVIVTSRGPLPVSLPANSPVQSLANRRILVAEDEGLIALDLESMLQGFG